MLTLSRKRGQRLLIFTDLGERVELWFDRAVRVGIEAPKGFTIHRKEVYDEREAQDSRTGTAR